MTTDKNQYIGPWDDKCSTLEYHYNIPKSSTLSPIKNKQDKAIKCPLINSQNKKYLTLRKNTAYLNSLFPTQIKTKQSINSQCFLKYSSQQINLLSSSPHKQSTKRYRISTRYGNHMLYFNKKWKQDKMTDILKRCKSKTIDYQCSGQKQSYNFVTKRKTKF